MGLLFQGAPLRIGPLFARIILVIMPDIASGMRNALEVTPPMLKDSAYCGGAGGPTNVGRNCGRGCLTL